MSTTTSVSEHFRAADHDLTLRSADAVLFHVHRATLEAHSAIFAAASAFPALDPTEHVPLSEPAHILDLLLRYIYRRRQPDLPPLPFPHLAALAEAAEKYEVYAVMELCAVHMRAAADAHPTDVLNYAVKHKYPDIMDAAAQHAVGHPLRRVLAALEPAAATVWIEYYGDWQDTLAYAYTFVRARGEHIRAPTTPSTSSTATNATTNAESETKQAEVTDSECETWTQYYALVARRLGGRPEALKTLDEVFRVDVEGSGELEGGTREAGQRGGKSADTEGGDAKVQELLGFARCAGCECVLERWRVGVQVRVDSVRSFSSLL